MNAEEKEMLERIAEMLGYESELVAMKTARDSDI